MQKNNILLVAAVVLSICSWFLLPNVVAIQIGLNGAITNTAPKLLAISIPLAITLVGTFKKSSILSLIGIVAIVLTLLFNL